MSQDNKVQQKQQIPGPPDLYSNAAKVTFNRHEFEITFGLGSSNYEGVRPVVNMRLSPSFCKEVIRVMQNNMEAYENHYGEIILPEKEQVTQ